MPLDKVHLVGFGSQGSAWAQCLVKSGWQVQVYLPFESKSFQRALTQGFETFPIEDIAQEIQRSTETPWIAMLCPDPLIPVLYQKYLASVPSELRLILAHGYAVYSGDLQFQSPQHRAVLLAPKAIGPKLLQGFLEAFPQPHRLIAALSALPEDSEFLIQLARALGFDRSSLVPASFNEEAVGDLMSEQGLLCGGVFNLLEWTLEAMKAAGIPEPLIREECLSELELIAGMIRDKGPATTFRTISQIAQCGTIAMAKRFEASGFKKEFMDQMAEVQSRKFAKYFGNGTWREENAHFTQRLETWENQLQNRNSAAPLDPVAATPGIRSNLKGSKEDSQAEVS